MYLEHFGLERKPFRLQPDPRFLFETEQHNSALSVLEYTLLNDAMFCVISGEIGSGKTTLVRSLMEKAQGTHCCGFLSNTNESMSPIQQWVNLAFKLPLRKSTDVALLQDDFMSFLADAYLQGRKVLLVIDEAQNLTLRQLENIRLISNINSSEEVHFQVILVGQPGLRRAMQHPKLKQFAQRVSMEYHLEGLKEAQVAPYIRHRLICAGGNPHLFDDRCAKYLAYYSRGIPRVINNIADMALVYAFAKGDTFVSAETIISVVKDRSNQAILPLTDIDQVKMKEGKPGF